MFAFLSQKTSASDSYQCTAVSWSKQNDMIVAGRSDGIVVVRQMSSKTESMRSKEREGHVLADEQNLTNHQAPVRQVAWNPRQHTVATGDADGVTTVWKMDVKTGVWSNYMATRSTQRAVVGMQWTSDGERICIIYETGTVMVGKIDGVKLWSVEVKHAKIPAWLEDGETVLVATTLGEIFVYDKTGTHVGQVQLSKIESGKISQQPLVDMRIYWASGGVVPYAPVIVVAFEDGKCCLLQDKDDQHPIVIQIAMSITALDWSPDGRSLAIIGRSRKSVANPEETAQLMIYTAYGKHEYTMRYKNNNLTAVSWDAKGQRLAVVLDGTLTFVVVKRPVKFCAFAGIVAYSCAKQDSEDALLVLYNMKTEKKVTVKHYAKQRILCMAGGGDFCSVATKTVDDATQYNIYVLNDTGATINISYMNVQPGFTCANDNQIFMASRELVFVWNFRQSAGVSESVLSQWDTAERYFHVDDSHGFIDLKQNRQRLYEVSADPICAIAASKDALIVARESGAFIRYSLPYMTWEQEYPSVLPNPRKLGLNKNASRLLILSNEGYAVMYALQEIRLSKDAEPVKEVKVSLERGGIWDLMWAEEDEEMFVIAQKLRAVVYKGREPEEPVTNDGYFCTFRNLEICIGNLDDVVRSAVPTEPQPGTVKTIRTKALRVTHQLMDTASSLAEAQHFVETNPHPVLWNLIADRAVQKQEMDLAELCYIHGGNYRGILLVKRMRQNRSERLKKGDLAAYFGDHYRAEQEYQEANRPDLAADLRRIAGDWFRLKEMATETQNHSLLKEAHMGLGKYYDDHQLWDEAINNYLEAKDYAALFRCYTIIGDTGRLEELADSMPIGHPLLVDIGRLLGRYGDAVAAARILRNGDRVDLAIESSIDGYQFQAALELSRTFDLDGYSADRVMDRVNKAVTQLVSNEEDTPSMWNAANLYYNIGSFLEAAKCLFKILAVEKLDKDADALRLKKIAVLAASSVEEFRQSTGRHLTKGELDKSEFLQEEMKSADYPFLDSAWRPAEAYNILQIARTYYGSADYARALRASGTLCTYTDVIDAATVYSMIALNGTYLKRWDVVNEAVMRIAGLEDADSQVVQEIEAFADQLFAKFSPKDVDVDAPLPSPSCLNCHERISIWDIKCEGCGTKYPVCMATGTPIAESEVWQCQFCHHHCAASAALNRRVCALCHHPS